MKLSWTLEEAMEYKRQDSVNKYVWFAWYPVKLRDHSWVWWEKVVKRKVYWFNYSTSLAYFWVYEKHG